MSSIVQCLKSSGCNFVMSSLCSGLLGGWDSGRWEGKISRQMEQELNFHYEKNFNVCFVKKRCKWKKKKNYLKMCTKKRETWKSQKSFRSKQERLLNPSLSFINLWICSFRPDSLFRNTNWPEIDSIELSPRRCNLCAHLYCPEKSCIMPHNS